MIPHPKPHRGKDDAYRNWVRARPCAVLGCHIRPCDPHHIKTVGAGGYDHMAIPLCRIHHTELQEASDATVTKALGRTAWEEAFLCFYEYAIRKGWIWNE